MKNFLITEEEKNRILGMHKLAIISEQVNIAPAANAQKPVLIQGVQYTLPGIKDEQTLNQFLQTNLRPTNEDMIAVLGDKPRLNFTPDKFNQENSFFSQLNLSLVDALKSHAIKGRMEPHKTFKNLADFVKAVIFDSKKDILRDLKLTPEQELKYMDYYRNLLATKTPKTGNLNSNVVPR
jgi:hypothetical protein